MQQGTAQVQDGSTSNEGHGNILHLNGLTVGQVFDVLWCRNLTADVTPNPKDVSGEFELRKGNKMKRIITANIPSDGIRLILEPGEERILRNGYDLQALEPVTSKPAWTVRKR